MTGRHLHPRGCRRRTRSRCSDGSTAPQPAPPAEPADGATASEFAAHHDLDRYRPLQPEVPRLVDRSHAAFSERSIEAVSAIDRQLDSQREREELAVVVTALRAASATRPQVCGGTAPKLLIHEARHFLASPHIPEFQAWRSAVTSRGIGHFDGDSESYPEVDLLSPWLSPFTFFMHPWQESAGKIGLWPR